MADDKRIPELPRAELTSTRGVYAIYDPILDKTVQINIQSGLGAVRADMNWQADITYSLGSYVLFQGLTAWISLQDNNIGNVPAENQFWTAINISAADGITDTQWEAGLFTFNKSKVVYNSAQYYLQVPTPFESVDIDAEIINGDWGTVQLGAVEFIDFNEQLSAPAHKPGRMWFGDRSFNFYDIIQNTSVQIGKEEVIDVYNKEPDTITNFTVVNLETAVNGTPGVIRALADTIENARAIGVATHDILSGEIGKITSMGAAGGDTSMWNVDDTLFVSSSVPGLLTNEEQEILSPVAVVLISATEANGGKIYIFKSEIRNITALGGARGANNTQVLDGTPAKLNVYDLSEFELNTVVTQVGAGPATAEIRPASIGATGYYRLSFNISIVASVNQIHYFEAYRNGVATGIMLIIDLSNQNISAGNGSFSSISVDKVYDTDTIEIYGYTDGGTSTMDVLSVSFNVERIGNA